jgi:uncharacterized membrane protein YeaQ/YmgE (transglycosylase-associated protein family)
MGIIAWIIMGFIAGTVAKMIMKQGGGWLSSILLGIGGGVVGGWIGDILFNRGTMSLTSPVSWILAIAGACLVIWIFNLVTHQRRA